MKERIEFTVYNLPPKKPNTGSVWSSNQAKLVYELRKEAFKAQQTAGITNCFLLL